MINRIKSRLVRLFSELFPMLALRLAQSFGDISSPSMRGFRALLLRVLTGKLRTLMQRIGFHQAVMVRPDGNVFVEANGILLCTRGTNRYFKLLSEHGNEGELMLTWLRNHGIEPETILDVGANFGEISLYFSRTLPGSRIYAVEPSTPNLEILRLNMQAQLFSVDNVTIIPKALADQCMPLSLTLNSRAENQLVTDGMKEAGAEVETVECLTIDALLVEYGIGEVDFCKIDIEGAEPLLMEGLLANAGRIRALLVEFSRKVESEAYLRLMHSLMDAGYSCCVHEYVGTNQETLFLTKEEAEAKYLEFRDTWHDRLAIDFWFLWSD